MVGRFLLAAGLLLLARPAPAEAQDGTANVMEAVHGLFAAMKAQDTTAMAAALDSAARFTLTRPSAAGIRVAVLSGQNSSPLCPVPADRQSTSGSGIPWSRLMVPWPPSGPSTKS